MSRPFLKFLEQVEILDPDSDLQLMAIHIAADPTTLKELQTTILIDCQLKGIPYVQHEV